MQWVETTQSGRDQGVIIPKSDLAIEVPTEIQSIAQRRWAAKQSKEWFVTFLVFSSL